MAMEASAAESPDEYLAEELQGLAGPIITLNPNRVAKHGQTIHVKL